MSANDGSFKLPEELEHALRRATDRTLVALTALRTAVRLHVRNERANGTDLDAIQLELRAITTRALDGLDGESGDGHHDGLATEMIKWSAAFYTQK